MKCVGNGLWHEDCFIHYRKTVEIAFFCITPFGMVQKTLFLRPAPKERARKQRVRLIP